MHQIVLELVLKLKEEFAICYGIETTKVSVKYLHIMAKT